MHNEKSSFLAYFMRILNSCVVLARLDLANRGARQPASPAAHSCAPVLVIDKASVQPDFAVVNFSDVVMSVLYSPVSTCSLIFLQLRTVVS